MPSFFESAIIAVLARRVNHSLEMISWIRQPIETSVRLIQLFCFIPLPLISPSRQAFYYHFCRKDGFVSDGTNQFIYRGQDPSHPAPFFRNSLRSPFPPGSVRRRRPIGSRSVCRHRRCFRGCHRQLPIEYPDHDHHRALYGSDHPGGRSHRPTESGTGRAGHLQRHPAVFLPGPFADRGADCRCSHPGSMVPGSGKSLPAHGPLYPDLWGRRAVHSRI